MLLTPCLNHKEMWGLCVQQFHQTDEYEVLLTCNDVDSVCMKQAFSCQIYFTLVQFYFVDWRLNVLCFWGCRWTHSGLVHSSVSELFEPFGNWSAASRAWLIMNGPNHPETPAQILKWITNQAVMNIWIIRICASNSQMIYLLCFQFDV